MKYLGGFLLILSLFMLVIGAGAFTSRGEMSFVLREFGEISFTWWLPTFILGAVIILVTTRKKA